MASIDLHTIAKDVARAFRSGGVSSAARVLDHWRCLAAQGQGDDIVALFGRATWVEILHDEGIGYVFADNIVPTPRRKRSAFREHRLSVEQELLWRGLSVEARCQAFRGIINGAIDNERAAQVARYMSMDEIRLALAGVVWC